jgi:Arc/MetJ-type ribon-helix-helix transcriptional regulator
MSRMKSMVSISLPAKMNEEIDAIIKAGYYDNRSELIRDAVRSFMSRKSHVRLVAALKMYERGKATIARAAEIAGMPFEDMKIILEEEGLLRRGRPGKRRDVSKLEGMVQ